MDVRLALPDDHYSSILTISFETVGTLADEPEPSTSAVQVQATASNTLPAASAVAPGATFRARSVAPAEMYSTPLIAGASAGHGHGKRRQQARHGHGGLADLD